MHERIELVSDYHVKIKRYANNFPADLKVDGLGKTLDIDMNPAVRTASWDALALEAQQLAIACYRQTGSFAALADTSAVPFVGKKVRMKRSNGSVAECTVVECCDNGYFSVSVPKGGLFATTKDNLLPLTPQPTYRPYTPAEAVQFLGRTLRSDIGGYGEITSVAKNGAYVQIESHEVHHGVRMQSLIDWKTLCDHWVIHDTGEVCGMKEEA